jgi:sulfide:quinone oxidoreductase
MTTNTVLVLGGGTGGISTARALRRRLAPTDRVVLVERSPIFRFAPSFLWVMSGSRQAGQITADVRGLRRRGIEVVEASVDGIDPPRQRVVTSAGELPYDRLVVALGAELAPETLPGFAAAAHNLYALAGAESANRALAGLERGRVAILVSRLPYKCPAAPYEAAFLAEAFLRRRGVRPDVAIDVYTPEPLPMPTAGEEVGRSVAGMLEARGIDFHPGQTVERIESPARRLVFADGAQADYDVLIGIPPHRAPAALAESGLAGPSGFVSVDRHSLATALDGVHAIGDATQIPLAEGRFMLPKAGVFAHAQARIVAERIACDLLGHDTRAAFDGRGACFLELGDGAAGYASGDFYAAGAPQVRMRRPGPHWHLAKIGLERYFMRRWF